jgi:extracellular factor (EF) 3-hydroxypalmitic acid methyl ester biosynthesis protein
VNKAAAMPHGGQILTRKNRFVLAWKMVHSADEMSKVLNGNGNGNGQGTQSLLRRIPKKVTQAQTTESPYAIKESKVIFQTAESLELQGALSHVTRHTIVFELYNPAVTLRLSEVLLGFEIIFQERIIYSGRATTRKVVDGGTKIICEATLNEEGWRDLNLALLLENEGGAANEFKAFLKEWQKLYKVLPEFKIVISDMQFFLQDLRLWLEQLELKIHTLPLNGREMMEQGIMKQVGELFVPIFDKLHERLEAASKKISEELRPAHQVFAQKLLHPLVLCSPFANRAFSKPLGYAGDYGMVNMIALNPFQGNTLFSKIMNLWFLRQWPSQAHRNRLSYLKECLENETSRTVRVNGTARIFNFACGPAIEVQNFLAESPFGDQVEFTLVDFNEETLNFLGSAISHIKERLSLKTKINFQRKTVYQLIKEGEKATVEKPQYDFVYCAGLFDYLPDETCTRLMKIFYSWLAPGGLLAVTNVVDEKPFRHMLEFVLDWHLIYRNTEKGAALIPKCVPEDVRRLKNDVTGVNLFIEARKPYNV